LLLRRYAARKQVDVHDRQRLGHEAKRQLPEGCERAQEESGGDDEDERDGDLLNDDRAAHREAPVARPWLDPRSSTLRQAQTRLTTNIGVTAAVIARSVPTRNSISSNCGLATGFLKTRAVRSGRRAPVTFEASRAVINGAVSIVAC
jgi:hypothetical protein